MSAMPSPSPPGSRGAYRFVTSMPATFRRVAVSVSVVAGVLVLSALAVVVGAEPAGAAAGSSHGQVSVVQVLAVNDLPTIVSNLRNWIMGLLAGVATLFLTIGGIRYVMAGGDPSEVERAKAAFRSAAVGYVLAVIAPVVLTVLNSIIGN